MELVQAFRLWYCIAW